MCLIKCETITYTPIYINCRSQAIQFNRQRMGNLNESLMALGSNSSRLMGILQSVNDPYCERQQKKIIGILQSNNELMAEVILKLKVWVRLFYRQ